MWTRVPDHALRRRSTRRPSRPQTLPHLSPAPAAAGPTQARRSSGGNEDVRVVRLAVPFANGHRRPAAVSLPATLLFDMLAVRRSQHVEGPTAIGVEPGARRVPPPQAQCKDLSLAKASPAEPQGAARS